MGARDRSNFAHAWAIGVMVLWVHAGVSFGAGPEPDPLSTSAAIERAPAHAEGSDAAPAPAERHAGAAIESRPIGIPNDAGAMPSIAKPVGVSAPTRSETRTVIALGSVIVAILALAWGVRRVAKARGGLAGAIGAGGRAPSGLMTVIGRYPIARGQTLILLRLDRRVLLLSQTWARGGARLATLSELTDPEEVASILVKARDAEGESVSGRFRAIVEKFNHEPSERAVTVVAPVARGDWFERGRNPAQRVIEPNRPSQATTRAIKSGADGAAALRSRLEAIRAAGGRQS